MKRRNSPLKILLLLCLLTIAVLVVVNRILSSDWPRAKLQSLLSSALGADVGIGKFDFTRGGDTAFSDLRLKLPADKGDILNIKELHIKHNSLLDIILNRNFEVYSIEMPSFEIYIRQMPEGRWNIQDIEGLFTTDSDTQSGTNPFEKLRNIKVKKFIVHIEDASGETVSIPLAVEVAAESGEKTGGLGLKFGGKLLEGEIQGDGKINLAKPLESIAAIKWEGVDIGQLKKIFSQAELPSGLVSGNIKIEPSAGSNPLEPVMVELNITAKEGIFEDFQFEQASFKGVAGMQRLLITESEVLCLGGSFNPMARLSRQDERFVLYINSDFSDIDANQLIQAIGVEANPISGRLSGKGFIVTSPDFDTISGKVDLTMDEMNLAENDIIAALYGVVRPNTAASEFPGSGSARIGFDGTKINIDDFYYFNRGFEVYGNGRIADTSLGGQSPVSGIVFATIRPFKDVSLPGAKAVDKTMLMLQKDLASVRICGTIDATEIRVAALSEIQSAIKAITTGVSPF